MVEKKKKYCPNWFSYIRPSVIKRANGGCERCDAEQGKPHPKTAFRVFLTVTHWNGNIKQNDGMDLGKECPHKQYANVLAVCQECFKQNIVKLEMKKASHIRDDQESFDFYTD